MALGIGLGIPFLAAGGAGAEAPGVIAARPGSFILTGDPMTPTVAYRDVADVGTFTETGVAAGLLVGHVIAEGAGSFALTGQAANLTQGSSFSPASLSPTLWVEARNGVFQSNAGSTAASANNDPVGYVTDLSGNAKHCKSLADDSTRPLLGGVGANPYLSFDGSNDMLQAASAIGLWNARSSTIALALRGVSTAVNTRPLAEGNSGNDTPIWGIISNGSTATSSDFQVRDDAGGVAVPTTSIVTPNAFDGTDRVLIMTDDGSTLRSYLDGSLIASFGYTFNTNLTVDALTLGALRRSSISGWWAGRIYAAVIISGSVIGSTDRASLTTYLGALCGRTL